MLVSLAMVASAAVGKNSKPSAAQYQYKVTICHRTKSKKKPFHTITVSSRAVPAHLKHGDVLGPCPTVAPQVTTTATSKGSGKGKKDKPQKGNQGANGGQSTGPGASSGQSGGGNGNGKGKDKGK